MSNSDEDDEVAEEGKVLSLLEVMMSSNETGNFSPENVQ